MKQIFIQTAAADLLGKAAQYKKDGYRMVQILCTRVPEGIEVRRPGNETDFYSDSSC